MIDFWELRWIMVICFEYPEFEMKLVCQIYVAVELSCLFVLTGSSQIELRSILLWLALID